MAQALGVVMDDYFSDDDLDALNVNALQELENTAIQFTQAQRRYEEQSQTYDFFEDDDLDDAVVQDELRGKSALPVQHAESSVVANVNVTVVPTPAARIATANTSTNTKTTNATISTRVVPQQSKSWGHPPAPLPSGAAGPASHTSSSAGQFVSQAIVPPSHPQLPHQPPPQNQRQHHQQLGRQPLGAPHLSQRQSAHQQRQPQQQPHDALAPPPPPFSQTRRPHHPPPLQRPHPSSIYQASQQSARPTGPTSHELAALQAQILDLQTRLNTKDGEIQIVRSRLEKTRQDHDREVQALRKKTSEQIAKYETAIEAAKAAERTTTTELEFTRRDLREELDRVKRRDGPATPRKNAAAKAWGVSDGFEDVEMAGSPTKGQRGRNAGPIANTIAEPTARVTRTPTKGGKRKRHAIDSPINALETHSEEAMLLDEGPTPRCEGIAGTQAALVAPGPSFDVSPPPFLPCQTQPMPSM